VAVAVVALKQAIRVQLAVLVVEVVFQWALERQAKVLPVAQELAAQVVAVAAQAVLDKPPLLVLSMVVVVAVFALPLQVSRYITLVAVVEAVKAALLVVLVLLEVVLRVNLPMTFTKVTAMTDLLVLAVEVALVVKPLVVAQLVAPVVLELL
jgi:hypothetical protein